ncbi:MAG: hypothetical protein ACYTFG_07020 [Planctomycetota bacterium]|jgi:hypothetical protein
MSKGKRGVALNKPCPKCNCEVPALYKSPVQEGLCGKCTDEILRKRASTLKSPASGRITSAVPGGSHTIVGVAVGLFLGVLLSLLLAVFASGLWGDVVSGIGGIFGR